MWRMEGRRGYNNRRGIEYEAANARAQETQMSDDEKETTKPSALIGLFVVMIISITFLSWVLVLVGGFKLLTWLVKL